MKQIGFCVVCLVGLSSWHCLGPAARAQSGSGSDADLSVALRDSINLPTLDELLGLTPKKANGKPVESKDPSSAEPVDSNLNMKQAAHLFERAVQDMGRAAERLDRSKDAGLATQRVQQSILAKLDQIISTARTAQQRKSRGGRGGPGGQNRKKAANANVSKPTSSDRKGTESNRASAGGSSAGRKPKAASSNPLREHRTEWGHLPVRLREQLLQGLGESFSPLYQKVTEEYYRLLAEQENQP